jgi:hypothetical protein
MKYSEILRYITGFSTPLGGLQWTPPPTESKVVHDLVTFLEGRRVLFEEDDSNEPAIFCRQSVELIRNELTTTLQSIDQSTEIKVPLRKFRTQCHKFCNEIGHPNFNNLPQAVQSSLLNVELQQLRKVAGQVIGELSVSFQLDIDDELAAIIPFKNR